MSTRPGGPARPQFRRPPEPHPDRRVLVLVAHPALHRSTVNRALAQAARGVPGVTVHDLYDAYPDFDVDVPTEKALLAAHPVIVFQFPFYWYSTPSLLKQWQDLVLEFGWAYGPGGVALRGKKLLCAISTGGGAHAYQHDGFHRRTVDELITPLEQTARLCGLEWLPPFLTQGANQLREADIAAAAARYVARLTELRDATVHSREDV